MLLILAAISLSSVFDERGIFKRTEDAATKYNEAKAREVLETVLLADGQYEKNINPDYNENGFLNELIKKEIPGTEIIGDVAIVDGWGFELDRSVPKIGRPLGKVEDLVFPTVQATVELADNRKNATINITAKEEVHGIKRIEIWLLGEKIKEYTYDNVKTEIKVEPPYVAPQNGEYTIKAFSDLWASTTVKVEGIVASVEFEPNGNEEWKKSHSTRVTIKETNEKVTNAKYQWTDSVTEPNFDTIEDTFKSGDTITKDGVTGTYYLWTMLETPSGNLMWRSEGFNFDNEGPEIIEFTTTKYSQTGITLNAAAQDTKSGIVKFEFYINDELKDTQTCDATTERITKSTTITGLTMGNYTCKVVVYDAENNSSEKTISGSTQLYTWSRWSVNSTSTYTLKRVSETYRFGGYCSTTTVYHQMEFNSSTGRITLSNSWKPTVMRSTAGTYLWRGSTAFYIRSVDRNGSGSGYTNLTGDNLSSERKTTQSKGTTQYSDVTSTSSNAYPSNGASGSYWYVYKGVQ